MATQKQEGVWIDSMVPRLGYTQKPQDFVKPIRPHTRTVPGLGIPTGNATTPLSCMSVKCSSMLDI